MPTTAKSQSEPKDINEILLVSPVKDPIESEFHKSLVIKSFPGRAVCVPPIEYRIMRTAQILSTSTDNSCDDHEVKTDYVDLGLSFGVGVIAGLLINSKR